MAKQKQFLQPDKKKGKRGKPGPETADEYLAAGVDQEEAGGKWRFSDAAKSSRFFVRAIESYQEGLQRFPDSFDLAYNKARAQYEISQQSRLLEHLSIPLSELLSTTLASHRYALNLRPDDADALFNTAQVLTSIGETLVEGTSRSTSRQDSVDLFREAVLLFAKCLAIQEKLYSNELTQAAELEGYTENTNPPPNNDTNATVNSPPSPIGEEWALIVEPITPSALLDTCLAQMQTLGSLIPLLPSDKSTVAEIENLAIPLLSKAESFASAAPPADQTPTNHLLARFNLLVAIADLSFRSSLMTIGQYADVLASTFADSPTLSDSANGLCDFADATFTFNASASQSQDVTSTGPLRWECLTKALQGLSKAVKVPDATNKAGMHSRKGDMELLRARLADPPLAYHVAASSRDTLLGNAETFYRGAKYVAAAEEDEQARIEMSVKEAIVKKVRGDSGALNSMLAENVGKVQEVMEGMMEDGLIIP